MNPAQTKIIERLHSLDFSKECLPIRNVSRKWLRFCSTIDAYDNLLIAHQPWHGNEAYGIVIFSPPKISWIAKLERRISSNVPKDVQRYLRSLNGCSMFSFCLFGLTPSMYGRPALLDRNRRQCLDLGTAQENWKRGYRIDQSLFHFGGRALSPKENVGYFIDPMNRIYVYRANGECVSKSTSFTRFLRSEIAEAQALDKFESRTEWWH